MNVVQPIRDPAIIEGIKYYLKMRSMRDFLLFCFGIYSGLRVSDLLTLRVWMVRGTHVKTKEKKNAHDKLFIVHPGIRKDLDSYIADMADDYFLFQSRQTKKKIPMKKQPIDRSTAYRMLNKTAKHFGLKEIGCHTLRKTWAYQLYKQDPKNLALLMKMFGHRDPAYTLDNIRVTQDMMDAAIAQLP
ncbi:tyrosine-type recombinase/integrase [Paenibacillus sp. OAS669]|uniref:tyrosine-type recombinase/integrase n=1 Tax=Paenibacillus sp. OAS669 TaxID=2663821 RepID=UPI00178ABC18|nr:tyrosine-type recombinase/integrase [Paenibacillus sp. OAS669]MBE1446810.1 integrase [Paenibacillus sp. OAS669]